MRRLKKFSGILLIWIRIRIQEFFSLCLTWGDRAFFDIFVNCSKTNSSRGLKKFRHMCIIKIHPHEQFGIDPDLRIIKPFYNMPSLKVDRELNFSPIELKLGMNLPKDNLSNISSVFSFLICRSLAISDGMLVLS